MKRQVNKRQNNATKRSRFSRILVLLIALSMLVGSSAVSTLAAPVEASIEAEKETEVDNHVGEDATAPDLEEPNGDVPENVASDSNAKEDKTVEERLEESMDVEQSENRMVARDAKAVVTITEEAQLVDLFPDSVFRAAVFEEVEGCSGATLEEALASFTGDIVSKGKNSTKPGGIKDIHGIEYLKSANLVDVSFNLITDFGFLEKGEDWYGVKDGTDREQGRNVYWIITGNPFKIIPKNFGGALVIAQPGTKSSSYSQVEAEAKKIVLRNEPGKDFGGNLDMLKCKINDGTPVEIITVSVPKTVVGIKAEKKSNEEITYSGVRKSGTYQIGMGTDEVIHYDTIDEYSTSTPGSQSFKYYVYPEFFVYDRVKIETATLGGFEFTKKEAGTGAVLAGAVFSLYKEDGTLVEANLTTDINGKISKAGLAEGKYYLQETKAPVGYTLDATPISLEIKASAATAEITGDKEITTDDGSVQTAEANEVFIAGSNSGDIGLSVPTGVTVKSVVVNYTSLDVAGTSTSGSEVNTTFATLAAAQADINDKKNNNRITGPVNIKVEAVDSTPSGSASAEATNEPDLVTIKGEKTWVDKLGAPEHPDVTLRLLQNGQPYPTIEKQMTVVLEDGTTNYKFKNLPAYGPDGTKYSYTVSEDPVAGFTSERTKTKEGFNFKNTFVNEYTEVHGTKTWIDEDNFDNMDGVMHSKAKVYLTRNDEVLKDKYVEIGGTKDKIEEYSFKKLPVYSEDGKTKYTYGVKEEFESAEEAAKYRAPNYIGNNIMNVFANAKTKVYVKKVWDDKGTADAHHPKLTFRLLQDGVPMKDDEGNQVIRTLEADTTETEVTFENLPEYADNGKKYAYTVVEDPVAGYQSNREELDPGKNNPIGFEFTNTRNADGKTSITAMKDWIDYDDWKGPYPTITVRLLQDGVANWGPGNTEVTDTIDKNKGETEVTFANLAETNADMTHKWTYTVEEINVPKGYRAEQTGNHITNIFENADKTSVSGTKTWVAKSGAAIPSIKFILYQDGVKYKETTLASDSANYEFTDLPKYADNGKKHIYTVIEEAVTGYTTESTHTTVKPGTKEEKEVYDFTNTFINEYTDIAFTKTWVDKEDAAKPLPSATFALSRRFVGQDDSKWLNVGGSIELTHDKNEAKFEHLPVYADASTTKDAAQYGAKYEYKVEEINVPEGYTVSKSGNHFYNTFENESVNISGAKTWLDAVDGTEHPAVTIRLLRDGVEYDSKVLQNGETSYFFDGLKKYSEEGKLYEYTIREDAVAGYKSVVDGYNIKNIAATEFTGSKRWEDDGDVNERRPDEITLRLFRDEKEVKTLKVTSPWAYDFGKEWPLYSDSGEKYEYTIKEDEVAEYTTEIKGTEIVNTLICANIEFTKMGKSKGVEDCSDVSLGALKPDVTAVSGARFAVYSKDKPEEALQRVLSNGEGVVQFENLPIGKYVIKETKAPSGYKLDETSYYAEVTKDTTGTLGLTTKDGTPVQDNQVINDVHRADITFKKVNEQKPGEVLPGSTYGLYKEAAKARAVDSANALDGYELIAKAVTDKDGMLTFKGVLLKTKYKVKELEAPNGSYVSKHPITISFELGDDKKIETKLDKGNGTVEVDKDGNITWLEPAVEVAFHKIDPSDKPVEGAKLEVRDKDNKVVTQWTSTKAPHIISGLFIIGETYKLVEIKAPSGYKIADPVMFTIPEEVVGPDENKVITVKMVDELLPGEPGKPSEPNSSNSPKAAKTGDTSPILPIILLCTISGICIVGTGVKKLRKKKGE